MMMGGMLTAGLGFLLPFDLYFLMPQEFKYLLFGLGLLLGIVGLIMLHFRAIKTGANHIIAPGSPNKMILFFIYGDDTLRIMTANRNVSGLIYSKKLDMNLQDIKSYRLFDHSVRIGLDGLGHSIDMGACGYAQFIKSKYGFKNISEARAKALSKDKDVILNQEYISDGDEIDEAVRKDTTEKTN